MSDKRRPDFTLTLRVGNESHKFEMFKINKWKDTPKLRFKRYSGAFAHKSDNIYRVRFRGKWIMRRWKENGIIRREHVAVSLSELRDHFWKFAVKTVKR